VVFDSRVGKDFWNFLIAQLTGGLLYGREVEKSPWFTPDRKRPYRPQPNRPAPRRQQVLTRLLNGWPERKIARDLTMHLAAVFHNMKVIFNQHGVQNRHELAKKLGSPHPQPLTRSEIATARRARIRELLLTPGLTNRQIFKEIGCNDSVYRSDVSHILRSESVKTRRALCEKHGVAWEEPESPVRKEIRRRHESGQGWTEIAKAMGRSINSVEFHARAIRREKRHLATWPARIEQ
jgi:DNA-binding NarL/FixJ family response regulator